MHPEQASMLALTDVVGTADVSRQHGLFNQLVRIVACTRHDLLNAARLVTHDLRLNGLKVDRSAAHARLVQCLIDTVQIDQVRHPVLMLDSLQAARISQDGCNLGIGKACVTPDDSRVKLVCRHLALSTHHHVANHAQTFDFRIERTQPVG